MRTGTCVLVVVFFALSMSEIAHAKEEKSSGELKFVIDESLLGDVPTIPGPNGTTYNVAVMEEPGGGKGRVVEDQVILNPEDEDDVLDFISKWGGFVEDDGMLLEVPEELEQQARDIPQWSGFVLIRLDLDPYGIDYALLKQNAQASGMQGEYRFSSTKTLALFALALEENSNGRLVELNGIMETAYCPSESAQEHPMEDTAPDPSLPNEGYLDPFTHPYWSDPDFSATKAWQLMEMYDIDNGSVPVAVIDMGFSMNIAEFPYGVWAWDFVGNDSDPTSSEEDYHGLSVLSIVASAHDNRWGGAGIAGDIVQPYFYRVNNMFDIAGAVRESISCGVDVVNISLTISSCRWWCHNFGWFSGKTSMWSSFKEAWYNTVTIVSSAGNDATDLTDPDEWAVVVKGGYGFTPIGVGNIDVHTKEAAPDSNWGSRWVNIWAPGSPEDSVLTIPTPDTHPDLNGFPGTSAAAPYVAGTLAMMKALRPSLGKGHLESILQDTANTSPDPLVVTGYVNVFEALRGTILYSASLGRPDIHTPVPEDEYEPWDQDESIYLEVGEHCANLRDGDEVDRYFFTLRDYYNSDVNLETMFNLGEVTGTGRGYGTPETPLPFTGLLTPGSYFLEMTGEPYLPNFYRMDLQYTPHSVAPDWAEDNDTLADAYVFVDGFPEERIGETITIPALTFHRDAESDTDYDYFSFDIPDLPDELHLYAEQLTFYISPTELGAPLYGFFVEVYDELGTHIHMGGSGLTIDNPRADFPDGIIRFLVGPGLPGNQNHYQIEVGYDRMIRPMESPPSFDLMMIPAWLEAMLSMHVGYVPPSILDGIPADLPFPSDPWMMDLIIQGQAPAEIPTELHVLKWDAKEDFVMDFDFPSVGAQWEITLIDHDSNVIAEAHFIDPQSQTGAMRMEHPELPAGFYGMLFKSDRAPTFLTATLNIDGQPQ